MSPVRRVELQARYEYVEALIAKAGSVRQAAKTWAWIAAIFRRLRGRENVAS